MEGKCLNCDDELTHTEGRRKRKYCSDACKGQHWAKTHKGEPKYVQYKTFLELLEKMKEGTGRNNQFENAARGRDKTGVNNDEIKVPLPTPAKSFQEYLRDIPNLELEEDCKDWIVTVRADSSLTPTQKYQLTERLKMKWVN